MHPLSDAAVDLMERFFCDQNERIGLNGIDEIKQHEFFRGVDWDNIRSHRAPFVYALNKCSFSSYNFNYI
jgi:hypothetical protein